MTMTNRFLFPFWTSLLIGVQMFVAAQIVGGCGYRAGVGERQLPLGYRLIDVPVFKNMTHETGVEVYFTNALIREIGRSRVGKVTGAASSQATLEGKVDSIQYVPINQVQASENPSLPSGTILTTEYRVLARVSLVLRRNSDRRVLWEGSFNGERTYLTPKIGAEAINSANAVYNHSARYQTIQTMAVDIMSEAHDRLTENF